MTESVGAAAAVAPPSTVPTDALDVDGASPSSSTSAAGSARALPLATGPPSSPSASGPSPPTAPPSPISPPTPAPPLDMGVLRNWQQQRPLPPLRAQSARVPPEWAGRPFGPMRAASYPFPCAGPCGAVCAAGTHAQPFATTTWPAAYRQPGRMAAHVPRVLRARAREGPLGRCAPRAHGVFFTGARALVGASACGGACVCAGWRRVRARAR